MRTDNKMKNLMIRICLCMLASASLLIWGCGPSDTAAPVINGSDFEVRAGDIIGYSKYVTVTDDTDPAPLLSIDHSQVRADEPGVYPVVYTARDAAGNTSVLTLNITVTVRDITPPVITAGDIEITEGETVDIGGLITVTDDIDPAPQLVINDSQVKIDVPGNYFVFCTARDASGNTALLTVNFTVKAIDVTPPVVTGTDFEITEGDSVSYKKQITVTDDLDPDPDIEIDNSQVDIETPGRYPITYTVTDESGNSTVLELYITVKEKVMDPEITEEYVFFQAKKILEQITSEDDSDLQRAYSIYSWCKNNIGYAGDSDKTNWVIGAYEAFTYRSGDCYTYFAAAKALLTVAGIENADVIKLRASETSSRHYWSLVNVGDGYYHFDCTRFRYDESNFFMLTTEELFGWDEKYCPGAHNFDSTELPEVATESVQDRVDYSSDRLKD